MYKVIGKHRYYDVSDVLVDRYLSEKDATQLANDINERISLWAEDDPYHYVAVADNTDECSGDCAGCVDGGFLGAADGSCAIYRKD